MLYARLVLNQVSTVSGLETAGVRLREVDKATLATVMQDALQELALVPVQVASTVDDRSRDESGMLFSAATWTPSQLIPSTSNKKMPYWEDSWLRHRAHPHTATLQTIAQQKNLQPCTILKHILLGFLHTGLPVDLGVLAQQAKLEEGGQLAPPSSEEWWQLEAAARATGLTVAVSLDLQNPNHPNFVSFCGHLAEMGTIASIAYKDRSEAEKLVC